MAKSSTTRHGNGAGWGGPARGKGRDIPTIQNAPQFEPGNRVNPDGPNGISLREQARRDKAWAIHDKAMDSEDERVALAAADKVLSRLDGLPIARTMDVRSELERMSDEQLDRAIGLLKSTLGGDLGTAGSGEGEAPQPEQVGRVSTLQ